MDTDAFQHYLADRSRCAAPRAGTCDGAAGGAPCGDLVRVSLELERGRLRARFDADGCAATHAAAAAVAEAVDEATPLDAARTSAAQVEERLGGLTPQGRHAAELASDALHRALAALAGSGRPLADPPAGRERVLVALSGGVDSAVAALRERDRGAEVVGVTLKLWADRRTDAARSCCSPLAVLGARGLAHSLGLPHFTLDLERRFRTGVVEPFIAGYRAGTTPNPCVACNGGLRIDAMLELAERLGCAGLVTGHYARIIDDGDGPLLGAGADPAKDQSYMLSALRPQTLRKLRFPLAELTKPEVRALAARAGLAVAGKAESQDLCFLAGEGKRSFLARHGGLAEREGEIVDRTGRVLGRHRGHHAFTVGQRRGLGVGGREPLYVLSTDAGRNRVVAGSREELATRTVRIREATLHRPGARVDRVRLRYHAKPLGCALAPVPAGEHERLELELAEPAFGVASGQTASLLDGELVVGHATID